MSHKEVMHKTLRVVLTLTISLSCLVEGKQTEPGSFIRVIEDGGGGSRLARDRGFFH